jgi:2-polyprenyl-3-methyl-5-hydroxy-6-metoxy-1,4-benzoquinol methylase
VNPCPVCASPSIELFCTAVDRVLRRTDRIWEIIRCRECGFGWTWPPLQEPDIAPYYPETYLGDTRNAVDQFLSGRLIKTRSWRDQSEKVRLVERLADQGRILDVGCGDGKFLWALDPLRWRRTGVEVAARTVEFVRSRLPNLELIVGDIHSHQLGESSFDVLTMWHVLEHLPGTRSVLRRALRLLRPGGRLVASVPNLAGLQAPLFRKHWYCFDDVPRHLHHFSPQSLRLLLAEAGFRDLEFFFFSRRVAFHSLKHSTRHWCEYCFGSLLPYYLLKPLLGPFQWLEHAIGRFSILTVVCRRP